MRPTLTILTLAVVPALASACGYGMPSPTARMALADSVLIGKVTAVESRSLSLRFPPSTKDADCTVVVVKVREMLKGDDRLTHVRIALRQQQVLHEGWFGCFFLNAHSDEPVHVLASGLYDYPITKDDNPDFDAQVSQMRKMGKLLRHPEAGLTSKNAEDRFLTAALLISEFRSFRPDVHEAADKVEPIDANLNRLILKVLAESDWKRRSADFRANGWTLFHQLGAKSTDGIDLSKMPNHDAAVEAAKSWLKDDKNAFRIRTFVRR